jgi:hypothetical protein
MKTEKFQLRGKNSMWAAAFQLLRGRAPAQLRGNTAGGTHSYHDALNSYELTNQLTLWNKIIFQRPTVTYLVKK